MDDACRNDESVRETLRAHGVTPTVQRVQIGRLVLTQPRHFSTEQLYEQVNRAGGPYVSKATVYNTVGLFARKGLLRQVLVDPSKVFYDSNTSPHHHFYNVESGELEDIDAGAIEIGPLPAAPPGVEVESIDVIVRIRRSTEP